jgi:hypothetical protein
VSVRVRKRDTVSAQFADWLRTFPLLVHIGAPSAAPEVLAPSDEPAFFDRYFWFRREQQTRTNMLRHMSLLHTVRVQFAVAADLDENVNRFDPLTAYYRQRNTECSFTADGWALEASRHVVDVLAWAACELLAGEPGFFTSLLPWYDRGRWPIGWDGAYPAGRLRVL